MSLEAVAATLRDEGGLLAQAVTTAAPGPALRVSGPRAFAIEAIREGHLLHHGTPRVVVTTDPDLALLAGDRLYALGLANLAAAGDLEAVEVMAEVIAGSAAAWAAGDEEGAEAAWEQGIATLMA